VQKACLKMKFDVSYLSEVVPVGCNRREIQSARMGCKSFDYWKKLLG